MIRPQPRGTSGNNEGLEHWPRQLVDFLLDEWTFYGFAPVTLDHTARYVATHERSKPRYDSVALRKESTFLEVSRTKAVSRT
jgi:hypothetical protein